MRCPGLQNNNGGHHQLERSPMSPSRAPYDPSRPPQSRPDIPRPAQMAQVQRPPSFPSSGFHSRADQKLVPGPQLPPLRAMPAQLHSGTGPGLPAMQLPPMEPSPNANEPARLQTSRTIPVSQLLSNSPRSPSRSHPPAQSYTLAPAPTQRPPFESYRTSPRPLPHEQPVYPPAPGHRFDQPPAFPRQPPPPFRDHQSPAAPLLQPTFAGPNHDRRDERQSSPVPTSYSSAPSCYETQNEPSPRTAAAPSQPLPRVSQVPPLNYNLIIRQQPAAARACGFGERDRRVIDPPPILELKITDRKTGAPEQDLTGMLALHCTLLNPESQVDETQVPPTGSDMQSTRRLMGTLVASPYQAKDEHSVAGTFFVFPDLSCRSPGRYRLHFKLLRIDPMNMQQGAVHGTVAHIITDVFSVYTAKDFPGMRASSALLKSLRRQGLNVGVKKGSEARKGKGKGKKGGVSSSEDDDSDGSGDERRGSALSAEGAMSPGTKAKSAKKRRRRDS